MKNHHAPTYKSSAALTLVGLGREFTEQTRSEIPQLWEAFAPSIGAVPGQLDATTYGVCVPSENCFLYYVAAVAVAPGSAIPAGMQSVDVPAGRYAIFSHTDGLATLHNTLDYIFGTWAPKTGELLGGQPDFERYDHRFNPVTGEGVLEYWVPVRE